MCDVVMGWQVAEKLGADFSSADAAKATPSVEPSPVKRDVPVMERKASADASAKSEAAVSSVSAAVGRANNAAASTAAPPSAAAAKPASVGFRKASSAPVPPQAEAKESVAAPAAVCMSIADARVG